MTYAIMAYSDASHHFSLMTSPLPPDPLLSRLNELANLPMGWEYGDGVPTLPYVYAIAQSLYSQLAFLRLQADAFPCTDGSLYMVFYADTKSVEIRIEVDGTLGLSLEEGQGPDFQEVLPIESASLDDVIYYVALLAQESDSWNILDSFIPNTMTARPNASVAPALGILVTEPEYHSSRLYASESVAHRYAYI